MLDKFLDDAGLTEAGVRPRSKPQRWRLIREAKFPKPVKLGSRNYWLESEVRAWLQAQVAARDAAILAELAGGAERTAAAARADNSAKSARRHVDEAALKSQDNSEGDNSAPPNPNPAEAA